jgi:Domain of unknown function (DUF4326)
MVSVVNIHDEPCDIPVCRPTKFGNPYSHLLTKMLPVGLHVQTREDAVSKFAQFFYSENGRRLRERALLEIPNDAKVGCHCAPKTCHADIIAGYLNWKRDYKFDGPKARTKLCLNH